jgi:hypothetical protein
LWTSTNFGRPLSAGQPPPTPLTTASTPIARADAGTSHC